MTYCSNYSWKSFSVIDENSIRTDSNFSTGDSFTYGGADATMYVYDNDGGLAGDNGANEQGTDSQNGWVQEDGQWTEAGNVYWEGYYVMQGSDGQKYYMIEIEGTKLEDGGNDYFAFYGKVPPQGVELTAVCYYGDSGSLSYSCLDGGELGASAIAPDANDDFLAVMQGEGFGDGDINVLLNDDSNTSEALVVKEVDGSASLVGVWLDLPEGGRILVAADGSVDFDAAGDFDALAEGQTATVSIDYVVLNSDGLSDTATLTIEVTGVNDAPVAVDQVVTTDEDTAITGNVMDGAYDIDGDAVSLDGISLGAIGEEIAVTTANGYSGTVVVNADGTFTYTPGPDADDMAQGEADTFTFDFTVKSQNGTTTVGNSRVIDFETGEAVVTYTNGAGNPGNDKPVGSVGEDPNGTGSAENGTTVGNSDGFGVDGTTTSGGGDLLAGDVVTTQIEGMTISVKANGKAGKYDEAMIFDSNNPTGGDNDLATNTQNNVLIISEDGKSGDPDDNSKGGEIRFAFDEPEDVSSLTLIDNEEGVWIGFFDANWCKTGEQWVPGGADNSINTVALNGQNVSYMIVVLEGSGAIDDLVLGNSYEVPAYLYDTATVTVNITGISDNLPPVVTTETGYLAEVISEDEVATGNINDSVVDPDGDTLTVSSVTGGVVGQPNAVITDGGNTGSITVNADGSYTYTPDPTSPLDLGDTDTVTVSIEVTDGDETIPVDIFVTINGVNAGPAAVSIALSMDENTQRNAEASAVSGDLLAGSSDADGDAVALQSTTLGTIGSTVDVVTTGGNAGKLTINADGTFTYTSNDDSLDLTETDTLVFDYTVASTGGTTVQTATKTVTITINGLNEAPVAIAQSVSVTEENFAGLTSSVDGNLLAGATDFDGDVISLASTTQGTIGSTVPVWTVGGRSGELTINADGTFTFASTDSSLDLGQSDTLTFDFTVQSTAGVLVQTSTATATININGSNLAPVTISSAHEVSEANAQGLASTLSGNLLDGSSDADGDIVSIFSTSIGAVGETVTIEVGTNRFAELTIEADGAFTLTSLDDTLDLNASDLLEIEFTAVSSGGATPQFSTSTASFTINGVNVAPVAGDVSVEVFEKNAIGEVSTVTGNLLANSTDADGDTVYLTSTTLGTFGQAVSVMTTGNRSGLLTVEQDGSFTFTSTSSDLDQGVLDDFAFGFTVSSTGGTTVQNSTATATININGINVPPVSIDQFYQTDEETPLFDSAGNRVNLLIGASDADGDIVTLTGLSDGLVISAVNNPVANQIFQNNVLIGRLTVFVDGGVRYQPTAEAADLMNAGDVDTVSFQYTVSSNDGGVISTSTKNVVIEILGLDDVIPNTPPVVRGATYTIDETEVVNGDLRSLVTDADIGDTISIQTVDGQALGLSNTIELTSDTNGWAGTLTVDADGVYSFDPGDEFLAMNDGDSEVVTFNYTASDSAGATGESTITINVQGVGDAPAGNAQVNYFFLIDASSSMFSPAGTVDCDFNEDGVYSWIDLSIGLAGQLGDELPAIWEDALGVTTSTAYYTYGSVAQQVGSPYDIDAEAGTTSNLAGALTSLVGSLNAGAHNEVIIFSDNLSTNTSATEAMNDLINNYNTTISSYLVGAASDIPSNSPRLDDCTDVTEEYWDAVIALEDMFIEQT